VELNDDDRQIGQCVCTHTNDRFTDQYSGKRSVLLLTTTVSGCITRQLLEWLLLLMYTKLPSTSYNYNRTPTYCKHAPITCSHSSQYYYHRTN